MSDDAFFDAIPKVELHCHLEGTLRLATVADLARKHRRLLPVDSVEDLYRFDSFAAFIERFAFVQGLLVDRDDWARIAFESVVDAAPHGLRYREAFFSPTTHVRAGRSLAEIVRGLTEGIELAERETGVRSRLICNVDRARGGEVARELVEALIELRDARRAEMVIGVGMDSNERGVDLGAFAPAFAAARAAGLRLTGHAGEETGAENVAAALDLLGLERIDHGVGAAADPVLLRRLADARIPLNVCPTSNVRLARRYASLGKHPFSRLREAGVLVTLNTDDPAMLGIGLGSEYRDVAVAQGLAAAELARVALDGVEAAWLDESERREMRVGFEAELAVLLAA